MTVQEALLESLGNERHWLARVTCGKVATLDERDAQRLQIIDRDDLTSGGGGVGESHTLDFDRVRTIAAAERDGGCSSGADHAWNCRQSLLQQSGASRLTCRRLPRNARPANR
jgi:hypothetical protein